MQRLDAVCQLLGTIREKKPLNDTSSLGRGLMCIDDAQGARDAVLGPWPIDRRGTHLEGHMQSYLCHTFARSLS